MTRTFPPNDERISYSKQYYSRPPNSSAATFSAHPGFLLQKSTELIFVCWSIPTVTPAQRTADTKQMISCIDPAGAVSNSRNRILYLVVLEQTNNSSLSASACMYSSIALLTQIFIIKHVPYIFGRPAGPCSTLFCAFPAPHSNNSSMCTWKVSYATYSST